MKFEEILECSKSNLLEEMRRKDLDAAKKEATRWKEEVQTKVDEQDALKMCIRDRYNRVVNTNLV